MKIKSGFVDYKKDGWVALAYCPYCGCVSKFPATSNKDAGAMTDAISDMKQHIESCESNPNREITDIDKLRDMMMGKSDD
jgi:hypothetical protein